MTEKTIQSNLFQTSIHSDRISKNIEPREYQLQIAEEVRYKNSLIILPTSLGKTICALYVIDQHYKKGKILLLAPTKPLINQHFSFVKENYLINESEILMLSGSIPPTQRTKLWKSARIIISTPEVIRNDVINGKYDLKSVSLIIFDECHRCSGDYAYAPIADYYSEQNQNGCMLGMTATPPTEIEYITEKFKLEIVSQRTTESVDVEKYTHNKTTIPIYVELTPLCYTLSDMLDTIDSHAKEKLKQAGYNIYISDKSIKTLNLIRDDAQRRKAHSDSTWVTGMTMYGVCMKLRHARTMLETQSTLAFKQYIQEIVNGDKASDKFLCKNATFTELYQMTRDLEEEHPKLDAINELVPKILKETGSKIIVFANYRIIVDSIVESLTKLDISCMKFVGQAKKGLTQKKQLETMDKFRDGSFSVLVSTSVGEEGLDVPSTDSIIFYEPVASKIRTVQRMGRTGRHADGTIYTLVTKGTADERNFKKNKK
jgi:Fanconi anemia group M protein